MQNAIASHHVMQFIGRLSFTLAVSVQVWDGASQLSAATSASLLAARFAFHATSHPLPGIRACAPQPAAGAVLDVPMPAFTNPRNRPTVTSYVSRRKSLTSAGAVLFGYLWSAAAS